jgi:hypothetical protein
MRIETLKSMIEAALRGAAVLLLGAGAAAAHAQVTVNLTAAPTTTTLPDGSMVPMWGYSCPATDAPACVSLNPNAGSSWSPVIITVPTGQNLTITLTNNLTFLNNNTVPTSLVVVGQLGGGLGSAPTRTQSPTHDTQQSTWPIAGNGNTFTPPSQGDRVQSFATEAVVGTPASLTWMAPRPGTYLLESGTHPAYGHLRVMTFSSCREIRFTRS